MAQQAKTIREHLLHGTVPQGKPERPSVYVGGRPQFPAHLGKVARREMKRVVRILEKRGTVTEGEATALALYGVTYERWVQCYDQIAVDGLMVTTQVTDNNGNLRTVSRLNPVIRVAQQCETKLQSLAKDLGLTPITRDKIKPTSANPQNEIIPGSIADTNPEMLEQAIKSYKERQNAIPS